VPGLPHHPVARVLGCSLLACGLGAVLVVPSPARAQLPPPSISLSPSQFPGVLELGQNVGPLTLKNRTGLSYRVQVFPVGLGQRRDGGIFVREDTEARAYAARYLALERTGFDFPSGADESVSARVKAVPRSRSLYEGLLFKSTPTSVPRGQQIVTVLQLNGSVLLDPPAGEARYRFGAERIRAEQAGNRRLRVLVPVHNRGNVYTPTAGSLKVSNARGAVVLRQGLTPFKVLPGAIVELPTLITKLLPAGQYGLSARVTAGPRTLTARGTMRLFGVNQLRTQAAKLLPLSAPRAYKGQPVEVKATFQNTGNVAWAPRAVLAVRPLSHGQRPARAALTRTMTVQAADPGARGEISATVKLPGSAPAYELRVRILQGDRELDSQAVVVTPHERPGLFERLKDWIVAHALVVVGLLLLVIVAGGAWGAAYIRRTRPPAPPA
jgi:hypothetical protein